MKIAVDIDDTLNVVKRFEYASEYIAREGLPFLPLRPQADRLAEIFDWKEEDVRRFLREGGGDAAFRNAEAREGAAETLSAWRAAGHEVIILTARYRGFFRDPAGMSREWLGEKGIPYDEVVADIPYEGKGPYCAAHGISVLVDDDVGACLGAQSAGVAAVLAVGRHNRSRAAEIAYGGENWWEIDRAVRKIAEEVSDGKNFGG